MNNNIKGMPLLGAGTFRLKDGNGYTSTLTSLEEGYRHIDTAQIYGNEKEIGKAIIDSKIDRNEIFLTTKIWIDNYPKDKLESSFLQSLKDLQVDYVDLILLHWPIKDSHPTLSECLLTLKSFKDKGLAKNIGVSNFNTRLLKQAIEVLGKDQIFTNQIEVHPYLTNDLVIKFCKENNIIVTCYMPFAYGDALKDSTIQQIAKDNDISPAQTVLAWIRQNGHAAIPSSTKRDNIKSNILSLDINLTEDEIKKINSLNKNHRICDPDFVPEWD